MAWENGQLFQIRCIDVFFLQCTARYWNLEMQEKLSTRWKLLQIIGRGLLPARQRCHHAHKRWNLNLDKQSTADIYLRSWGNAGNHGAVQLALQAHVLQNIQECWSWQLWHDWADRSRGCNLSALQHYQQTPPWLARSADNSSYRCTLLFMYAST